MKNPGPNGVYGELLGLIDTPSGLKARVEYVSGKRELVKPDTFTVLSEEDFRKSRKRINYNKLWYDKYGY
jgi:hypothetical protein